MPAYLAGSSSSSLADDGSHMYTFLDAVGAANNTCFGNPPCDPDCRHCDAYTHQCECLRWHINVPAKCKCPRLSSETLVAVGAVVLCLIMLLLAMAVWHWRRCGDRRTTDHTESLLNASEQRYGHLGDLRSGALVSSFNGRGRTSIDSCVSCIVCMDNAINCVLMPCAHEVACQRCASRLALCPICRTAVGSTLKIYAADPTSSGTLPLPQPPQPLQQPVADDAPTAEAGSQEAAENGDGGAAPAPAAEGPPAPAPVPRPGTMAAMMCLRCAANPPNCVFLPCSHKVWCTDCAAELPSTCPICNIGITQSLRTFHKRF